MADIRIIKTANDGIAVISPYSTIFVAGARRLAGRWGAVTQKDGTIDKAWIFPAEVKADVRALLRDTYGEDGESEVPTVRLRVEYHGTVQDTGGSTEVVIGGREVARIFGRDSGARLGANIVLRTGGVGSGGSRKSPRIEVRPDTVFDLLRMPKPMAERLTSAHPDCCRIVADDGSELLASDTPDNVIPMRPA